MSKWKNFRTLRLNGVDLNAEDLQQAVRDGLTNNHGFTKDFWLAVEQWINEDDGFVVMTSGSTGQAKKISLSKEMMLRSAFRTLEFLRITENDDALLCISAKYIGGIMTIVRAFAGRLNLHITEPSSNPLEKISEESSFDLVSLVPYQLDTILKENKKDLNKIRNLLIGGAAVHADTVEKLKGSQCAVYHTYGMTETASHIALRMLAPKTDEYFTALPGIQISADERNCLCIKGEELPIPKVQTNDVVELHGKSKFNILGRFDNIINSGGVKINPEQIEALISSLVSRQLLISYMDDTALGQRLILIVEGEGAIDLDSVSELICTRLSKYHVPKQVFYLDNLSYTESGKVQRELSRQKLLDQLEA